MNTTNVGFYAEPEIGYKIVKGINLSVFSELGRRDYYDNSGPVSSYGLRVIYVPDEYHGIIRDENQVLLVTLIVL